MTAQNLCVNEPEFIDALNFRSPVNVEYLYKLPMARIVWTGKDCVFSHLELLRKTAVVSSAMLARNAVACPRASDIEVSSLRPTDYGRACIINMDCLGDPEIWDIGGDRLVDVKGVGVPDFIQPKHAIHRSGVMRLDEAIHECIIAGYLSAMLALKEVGFGVNTPLAILDTGYQTRSLKAHGGPALTPAALLVRPFCERPQLDLPSVDDPDHMHTVLWIELSLLEIGMTTLSYMNYTLNRVAPDVIMTTVMGGARAYRRSCCASFDLLESLLGNERRKTFRYPNVQTGNHRGTSNPLLVDLGAIDVLYEKPDAVLMRAHDCDFQIVRLPQRAFELAFCSAAGLQMKLHAALELLRSRYSKQMIGAGYKIKPEWGSDLEVISVGISQQCSQDHTVLPALIDEVVDSMTTAAWAAV